MLVLLATGLQAETPDPERIGPAPVTPRAIVFVNRSKEVPGHLEYEDPHVVIVERYKEGRKAMDSIFGGAGSFRWGTNTGLLLMPIVSLVEPILGVALALTLLIQGYVSVRIGILEARSQRDLGIAGVVAAVLATKGATWAFAVGVALCILIYGRRFFSGENDQTFTKDNDEETQ